MSERIIGTGVFGGYRFELCSRTDACTSCDKDTPGCYFYCANSAARHLDGNWKRIKPSAAPQTSQPTDRQYNATCMHCGETKDIQLWPHRNGHGDMIGFVFACAGCADIVRGITMEIHGIRGHSKNKNKSEFTCIDKKGGGA